eukprot:2982458-Amphidinium_carterae.1
MLLHAALSVLPMQSTTHWLQSRSTQGTSTNVFLSSFVQFDWLHRYSAGRSSHSMLRKTMLRKLCCGEDSGGKGVASFADFRAVLLLSLIHI